ncbi:N-acetylmuramoyl-L-alanine amidase [Aggregatibacter actinomycetemcomitans]|uniref:N-acetylmuramoyl-L-alanine amidase n=1 Tax=Aggregatibacter actinomycetemcomitans TaxID=714 RepID=UPI00197C57CC|nr:N-acetylmuramoyl-L-alanine amidase [Aggregatibacter actinomycetemcomitans]MBN6076111.1 N-acetylmuramoyl-L-alanine amidase [Aggregatibacter actinomycetemcomitans]
MFKERVTKIELHKNGEGQEYCIEIDDKAATRQAIINYINAHLDKDGAQKFVERSGWKAVQPKNILDNDWNYNSIVIHHQGNSNWGFICGNAEEETRKVQENEMVGRQNFDDIAYHYVVSCDGIVLEGRDIRFIGSHVNANNSKKIGILLLGDYSERGEMKFEKLSELNSYLFDQIDIFYSLSIPTQQGYACIPLIDALLSVFNIEQLGGHREFSLPGDKRTCPGNIGMQFVNYLRERFNLKSPKENNL